MGKKTNHGKILEFYHENGLDEIYSDNHQNQYIKNTQIKPTPIQIISHEKTVNVETKVAIKAMNSTSQALSELAKKNKNLAVQENNSNASQISATQFLSLNQIIDNAKQLAKSANTIDELRKIVNDFEGCNLKKMATNTVFSDGNQHSKIMVIGEAPGNNEDLKGIPFCGDSGELLDAMFASINLKREQDFYITNVIFWRPPGNRRPTDEEVAICRPFLERHIELFKPKLIILVGATAMSAVIKNDEPISKIRGKFLDNSLEFLNNKCKILTIFHPSFLMRQPAKKKLAWQDMLNLKDFISRNYE